MELGSHSTDFHEIWYLRIRSKFSREFSLKPEKMTGILHGDICTFMIVSCCIILRIRNVSDRRTENQSTHFVFNDFNSITVPFMR